MCGMGREQPLGQRPLSASVTKLYLCGTEGTVHVLRAPTPRGPHQRTGAASAEVSRRKLPSVFWVPDGSPEQ